MKLLRIVFVFVVIVFGVILELYDLFLDKVNLILILKKFIRFFNLRI